MKVCKANLTTIVDYKGGIIMMQIRMLLGVLRSTFSQNHILYELRTKILHHFGDYNIQKG